MYNWAEIIYGRTLEVDFRFLAAPDEDRKQLLTWAEPYVLESTCMPEKLPGRPRWLLMRNERFCLIGVTCMANELVAASLDTTLETMSRDNHSRLLYLFAGYIAYTKDTTPDLELPPYESLDLRLFARIYQRVAECWDVKPYDPKSREPINTHFQSVAVLDMVSRAVTHQTELHGRQGLNADPRFVGIFPDDAIERQRLWSLAATSEKPVSLCLGLARSRDAMDGPFLNVSVAGVTAAETISLRRSEKPERLSSSSPPKASALPLKDRTATTVSHHSDLFAPRSDKFLAAGFGSGVGFLVAGALSVPAIPTILCLGGLSYVGMGLLKRNTSAHEKRTLPNASSAEKCLPDAQTKLFGLKPMAHASKNAVSDKEKNPESPWKL